MATSGLAALRCVLFDLGGVLEEVVAAPQIEAWTHGQIPANEFWHRWLSAESVRWFESGMISPLKFATLAVDELGIHVDPQEFLRGFGTWLAGAYAGASQLVSEVRAAGFAVASFSNSNPIHWPIMESHQNTECLFDANFPSHLLGICKPDREAFAAVAAGWEKSPDTILFLDDNEINCEGARLAGMRAIRVQGVTQARAALVATGILRK